jgi:uncharacterized protein involved in type VI secretion and phage assembly
MTLDMIAPEVRLGGRPLDAAVLERLVSMRIERGVCVVGRATLHFKDEHGDLASGGRFALGESVQVLGGRHKVFTGVITGIGFEQRRSAWPELVVTAHDGAHQLARITKAETYLKSTYADIVKKLVSTTKLTSAVASTIGTSAVHEYVLRTGSPLALIDRIAQLTGTVWWVDDTKFHMQSAAVTTGNAAVALGDDLIEWSVRASALRPTEVTVTGWDPAQQQQTKASRKDARGPDAAMLRNYVGDGPSQLSPASTTTTVQVLPQSQQEADALAAGLLAHSAAGAVIARGSCYATKTTAGIAPLVAVQVSGSGPADGVYTVSEVEHVFTPRGFLVRFVAGPLRPTGLVETLGREAPDPGFRHDGVVVGVVSDNSDTEGGYGRVKVKYAALGEIGSAWARVATLGGGNDRGITFQYEIGDEVLVGFENGDTRYPVVLGGLFSKKNALPKASQVLDQQKVGYRRITTRGGHVLEFCDSDVAMKNYVLLALGSPAHQLRLGGDAFLLEMTDHKPITIKAGETSIEITQAGDVKIKGMNIDIQATGSLKLSGAQVEIKSKGPLSLEGATATVKGQGTAGVEGGGILTLKGGLVKIN